MPLGIAEGTDLNSLQYSLNINVLQFNTGRGRASTFESLREASVRKIQVLLLQEPYVGNMGKMSVPAGCRVVQSTGSLNEPVRSAIVVLDQNIRFIENSKFISRDIVGVIIKIDNLKIGLVSVYLDKDLDLLLYLNCIKSIFRGMGCNRMVVAGDFNASSPWWGCAVEDERGAALMELYAELGLEVANEGQEPTFLAYRHGQPATSIIDVTTCSSTLLPALRNWKVDPTLCTLSDHRPITFTLQLRSLHGRTSEDGSSTRVYNTARANWMLFDEELRREFERVALSVSIGQVTDEAGINEVVERYVGCVTAACEKAIPHIPSKRLMKACKWWTPELVLLKAEMVRRRRRIAKANSQRRQFVVDQYLEARTEYRKAIESAMTTSWKEFCTGEKVETLWHRSYRIIKACTGRTEDKLLESRDGRALDEAQSANLMADTFYPWDEVARDTVGQAELRAATDAWAQEIRADRTISDRAIAFTEVELEAVLRTMSPKKAPGGDGLTLDICFRAYRCDKELLLRLFSHCFKLGHFPVIWKVATIKVIPKPNRDSYTTPKSYRPIGLLPVLGKVLEKLFVNRLQWQLGREGHLSLYQYGFTPQRSAEDALYDAMAIIRGDLESKKIVVIVSLDIEGAFDNAWWPAIVEQLRVKHVDDTVARFILSYLSERHVRLRYAGEIVLRNTNKGCVQGSTCGPILWNLQLEPLLEQAQYGGVRVQAFADDILLIASGTDGKELELTVNRALAVISQWGEKLKLRFAPEKTQALLLTRKLRYHTPTLVMSDIVLSYSPSLKILGLTIDPLLNFKQHIENITKKAIGFYKVVSRAARAQWGLNSDILRLIYIAVVEPTVLYSASSWAVVSERVYAKRVLNSLTRSFAIKIGKTHRTVSFVASVLLARILPLTHRLRENSLIYKIKRGESMEHLPGRTLELRRSPFSLPHPADRKRVGFGLIESEEDVVIVANDGPVLFTDGSKLEGKVGGAVTCWSGGREVRHVGFRLENYCSVFQAELCAILRALMMVEGRRESTFALASDSMSSLEAVGDSNSLHPLAAEIREKMISLEQEGKMVRLFWVKAHSGIEGNERADELAKQAALNDRRQSFYDRFPLSFAKSSIRTVSINKWQQIYDASQTGSTTKLFFKNISLAYNIIKNIRLDNYISQILTGHGGFKSYLFRFNLSDSPFCSCGEDVPQSVQHLLLECVRFVRLRYDCESRMDTDLNLNTLEQIVSDKMCRPVFLSFAKTLLRIVGRENGSFIEIE